MPDLSSTLERYIYELEEEKRELHTCVADLRSSVAKKDKQIRELLIQLAKKI